MKVLSKIFCNEVLIAVKTDGNTKKVYSPEKFKEHLDLGNECENAFCLGGNVYITGEVAVEIATPISEVTKKEPEKELSLLGNTSENKPEIQPQAQ